MNGNAVNQFQAPQKNTTRFFLIGQVVMYSTVLSKSNCNSLIKYNRKKWTIFPESVPLHICVCVYCIGLEIGVLEQGPSFRQSSSSSTAVQSQSWTPPCRQIDLRYHRVSRLLSEPYSYQGFCTSILICALALFTSSVTYYNPTHSLLIW